MLDLLELELDGWLSYDKVVLKLSTQGTTFITGPVGSGKSAIFEAIFYLLFGKTLRDKNSVNELINKVLNDGYLIRLDFKIENDTYQISEIRGRSNDGLYFYKNGQAIAGKTDKQTRKLILDEIRISPEEFKAIAFVGQQQAQILITGTSAERANILTTIFGLQRYDLLIQRCGDDSKELTKKLAQIDAVLTAHQEELKTKEKERKQLRLDADAFESKSALLNKKSNIEDQIEEVNNKLNKLHTLAEQAQKDIGAANNALKHKFAADDLRDDIEKLRVELAKTTWPEETSEDIHDKLQRLAKEQSQIEVKIRTANSELQAALNSSNICPVNKKECPVQVPIQSKFSTESRCNVEIREGKEKLSQINRVIDKYEDKLELRKKADTIRTTLEAKRVALTKSKDVLDQPLEIDLHEQKTLLERCHASIQTGQERLTDLNKKLTKVVTNIHAFESTAVLVEQVEKDITKKEEVIQEAENKRKSIEIKSKYLAAFLAVFKRAKLYKIDMVLDILNKHTNDILDQISEGKYKAQLTSQQDSASGNKILDKIGIIVQDGYKTIPIELCSGGQSTEVGLAVLLAVWKASTKLSNKAVSSLWLDEVFGPLDEETVNRVFDSVVAITAELGAKNVKIISHKALNQTLFDETWNVKLVDGLTEMKIIHAS